MARGNLTDTEWERIAPLLPASQGRHESTQLAAVLDSIRVPRPQGRLRQRPAMVALDKSYSYPKCRQLLRQRGIRHVIPERKDRKAGRQAKGKSGGDRRSMALPPLKENPSSQPTMTSLSYFSPA